MTQDQERQILEGLEVALQYNASEEALREWFSWWNASKEIEDNERNHK